MKNKKIVSTVLATAMATAIRHRQHPQMQEASRHRHRRVLTAAVVREYISPMHSGVTRRRLQQLRRWLTSSTVSRIESK